jgi:hypothetical protein
MLIALQAGLNRGRLLAGSVGVLEATIVHEWEVADLAELRRAWEQLATIPTPAQWRGIRHGALRNLPRCLRLS